jgi:hypothetical protein
MTTNKIDFSKPVETIGGLEVQILSTTVRSPYGPNVGIVTLNDGQQALCQWDHDGLDSKYYDSHSQIFNLRQKKRKVTLYMNVYEDGRGAYGTAYTLEETARRGCDKTVKVVAQPVEVELP